MQLQPSRLSCEPNSPKSVEKFMTNPSPGKPTPTPSINDNLPTSNPRLSIVLTVFGVFVVIALVLTFHKSLGL
jgi:hypothetical protein